MRKINKFLNLSNNETNKSIAKIYSVDQIKTTNVNILLNRVRIEKKNDIKKKIFVSLLMFVIVTVIYLITISS